MELRVGRRTILEKLQSLYPDAELSLWVRPYLKELIEERYPGLLVNRVWEEEVLFISSRAILKSRVVPDRKGLLVDPSGEVVGFRLSPKEVPSPPPIPSEWLHGLKLPRWTVSARVITYPWDLVELNLEELGEELSPQGVKGELDPRTAVLGDPELLSLEPGARIEPGVVVDLRSGPVMLARDAAIQPPSLIQGPCWIGPGSRVEGAQLRPGCSIGPHCRVGGEVEASIFQGYANKHHLGFLGHSWVGEWVNLGALTTNSDLKNNYHPVRVILGGESINTGKLKVGCFLGDHVKTGIGTLIPTGAIIGIFSSLFGTGLIPKSVPDFRFGEERYEIESALDTARIVMSRRGVELTPGYERVVRWVYALLTTSNP